jgi:eukaryotic-like serine/threonine-protein kinase
MLSPGARVGAYEIVAAIGSGGMGEVYRARDTRLSRDVALKVLPDAVAGDAERLIRFEREARLLASLNHPHIAQIHGFEETAGLVVLIMELVEGQDLADRLRLGPIEVTESIGLARQIAGALEAAHAKGIIHRDLKPANIRITAAGAAKVLDFGLAKDLAAASAGGLDVAPTITSAATRLGTVLGTAAYMAPEQAKGLAVDKRADIWGFGCVLYEMLSGRSPFPGSTITETIAAVLERQPDWNALPRSLPAPVLRLLRRCLEKDPERRLHDIADARIELEDLASADAAAPLPSPRSTAAVLAAAVAIAALAAAAGWALRRPAASPEVRLEINTPPSMFASLALSPDGSSIVYVASDDGLSQLWLRRLDSTTAQRIPNTVGASRPFWSPDGRSIGFFAELKLKHVDVNGGSMRTLASDIGVALGAAWSGSGIIVYASSPGSALLRVAASGGDSAPATRLEMPQQRGHLAPQFLPDGRHFIFFVDGRAEARGVYVGQLDTTDTTRLFDAEGPATYIASGHLLFRRGNTLYAHPFDAARRQLSGQPIVVVEQIPPDTVLSASAAGPFAYRTRLAGPGQRQLVWFDRAGRSAGKVVYDDTAALGPALSHDGRRIAIYRYKDQNMDIWSYDIARRSWERLTFDAGDDIYPLWSAGDTSILFGAVRHNGPVNIYRRALSAPPESERPLMAAGGRVGFPLDWSPDGRVVLYSSLDYKRGSDLWSISADGDGKPVEVLATEFNEGLAQFSPDGRWIAYQSDKTARYEVYVRPFGRPGADVLVSTDGGTQPRWNPGGGELFYVAANDQLTAVTVTASPDGSSLTPGVPVPLFATTSSRSAMPIFRQQYVVAKDGQSFIVNSPVGEPATTPITVVLNWRPRR